MIRWEIDDRLAYLTKERQPVPGQIAESSEKRFAWMPGVCQRSRVERQTIETAGETAALRSDPAGA